MTRTRSRLFACALFLFALVCPSTRAAIITVNSTVDGSDAPNCTLRDAVRAANHPGIPVSGCNAADGHNDTIVFAPSLAGMTIDVQASGEIVITGNLTIDATSSGGAITLDAHSRNRILNVRDSSSSLGITGVTFINGNAGRLPAADYGGAIMVHTVDGHALTLKQCTFRHNRASYGGGAVWANVATISDSTFSGNRAGNDGGAVFATTATIRNSTFSGNLVWFRGGAVFADRATIRNSIFSSNTASNNRGDGSGGAVFAQSLDAWLLTLLGNTAGSPAGGQALFVFGAPAVYGSSATLHNSIIIGVSGNRNAQCAVWNGIFSGSFNLESHENDLGTLQKAIPATCGISAPERHHPIHPDSDDLTSTLSLFKAGLPERKRPRWQD